MEKMLLIDGNSLVNRAYYALPPLNNPQGMQVQAVFGFATMLVKMIETVKPDYIVTAFDVHAPTFRHKLYDGYKSRRKGMPDELAAQMPVLKEMLDVMGVRHVEMAGYEADDIIGTLSKRYDVQTYIVTGDRDSLQLVDSSTRVLLTKRGITEVDEIDETSLLEKYELTPQGIIDYKALAGDGSDDIPGVPGIGDKIAKNLLKQYGSLSGVYASLDDIGTRIRNILLEGKASAELSKTLATIDVAVPFECELEECKYEFPFSSSVFAFFESQGFKSLIRRAEIFTTGTVPTASSRKVAERVQIASAEKLREVIQGKTEVAMHVTESEFHFAVDEGTEYVVNLSYSFFDAGLSEPEIIAAVKDVLCDGRITKVVFDSKSFITYIYKNYKILCDGFFDVGLAQYIADATVPHAVMNGLFEAYSIAAADLASGMLTLKRELNEALNESGMRRLYYDIELPLVKVLFDMEQAGFEVNRARLEEIGAVYSEEEQRLTKQIHAEAGKQFNIKSPRQLAKVLFEDMGIPYPKKGAKTFNTNAEILEQLDSSYTIVPLVLRYRFITKLNSTYIDGLRKLLDAKGTVHTEFRQTLTTTGRLSSVEPNLQNIPVREEDGKILRSLFVAREGFTLVSADYSQIELRIMAHYSQDPIMLKAYREGADIHSYTAAQVFGVSLNEVTPIMRRTAKTVNFGIIYGISEFGLASNLKISKTEAKQYIENYFERFSGVREYLDRCVVQAKKDGYVTTLLGRRRKIPELFSSVYFTRQFGERAAMNMPLQGTAADIIKIAMLNVSKALEGMKSRLILQVHDELIVETAEDEIDAVKTMLKNEMENAFTLSVPLVAEVSEGRSWFDCK
ncbi:MAG: DNA polymerase I [Clostridia bacterium]|uniref:DNA polymerase I n=1 Tax=Pumilibacter muris TaxID=2941510 RepID=UPI00203E433C|nr:DNA polymerase I [Pumilibacter muris]MCI8595503.1 DNA polymerase I [Clostridia bacterium]